MGKGDGMRASQKYLLVGLVGLMTSGCGGGLLLGQRKLTDSDFWEPLDRQTAFGFWVDYEPPGNGKVGVEWGMHGSIDTKPQEPVGSDMVAAAVELYAGARFWPMGRGGSPARVYRGYRRRGAASRRRGSRGAPSVRPYLGLGATFGGAFLRTSAAESPDARLLGLYARGGVLLPVGESAVLGVDLRYVFATTLDWGVPGLIETDVDGLVYSFVIGWGY
jgi:hypothetical protein